jgi:hypothetical protein
MGGRRTRYVGYSGRRGGRIQRMRLGGVFIIIRVVKGSVHLIVGILVCPLAGKRSISARRHSKAVDLVKE